MKSKLYRFFAFVFALLGFGIFAFLYAQKSMGHIWEALRDPFTILILVFPFLPAIVLSWMATRAEVKLNKFLAEVEE